MSPLIKTDDKNWSWCLPIDCWLVDLWTSKFQWLNCKPAWRLSLSGQSLWATSATVSPHIKEVVGKWHKGWNEELRDSDAVSALLALSQPWGDVSWLMPQAMSMPSYNLSCDLASPAGSGDKYVTGQTPCCLRSGTSAMCSVVITEDRGHFRGCPRWSSLCALSSPLYMLITPWSCSDVLICNSLDNQWGVLWLPWYHSAGLLWYQAEF